jgi:hypothetical protein
MTARKPKIDHMVREGVLRKYRFGGNVRFRVQSALDLIEDATGERPDPWDRERVA